MNSLEKTSFILIGHDIASNALGRLLSMADVASEVGNVRLLAFGGRPIWKGASQFDHPVQRLQAGWKKDIENVLHDANSESPIIWLSKGLSPLDKVGKFVRKAKPLAKIILDLDDDDSALAKAFSKTSLKNKVKLNPSRRGSSTRILKSQSKLANLSDGFTFSTDALAKSYGATYSPYVRIPHARRDYIEAEAQNTNQSSDGVKAKTFGCFGTLRPHKGSEEILHYMRTNRDWTLVTFKNCGLGQPLETDTNWVELAPDTPLDIAYSFVNVALIPMSGFGDGVEYQLPAKLIDAMRASKPIVATATPPIEEIAQGCFTNLPRDATPNDIRCLLGQAVEGPGGIMARQRYLEILTPEAIGLVLRGLISKINHPE